MDPRTMVIRNASPEREGRCPMDRILGSLLAALLLPIPAAFPQEPAGPGLPDGALARVGSVQLRHQGAIQQLAFLPDGSLAALDSRGAYRVWDPATGHERRNFVLRTEIVSDDDEMMRMEMMMRMERRGMG